MFNHSAHTLAHFDTSGESQRCTLVSVSTEDKHRSGLNQERGMWIERDLVCSGSQTKAGYFVRKPALCSVPAQDLLKIRHLHSNDGWVQRARPYMRDQYSLFHLSSFPPQVKRVPSIFKMSRLLICYDVCASMRVSQCGIFKYACMIPREFFF